jgi:hypothetical protein
LISPIPLIAMLTITMPSTATARSAAIQQLTSTARLTAWRRRRLPPPESSAAVDRSPDSIR